MQDIRKQTKIDADLPLSFANEAGTLYVEPANRLMSERILLKARTVDRDAVRWCFFFLGETLAAFVNPQSIIWQTPETRTSRRLFAYDEVLQVLMPGAVGEFYGAMEQWWSWNARYWEQKALLRLSMHSRLRQKDVFSDYLRDAVAHARHAKALQLHQFPLTTLGTVLMTQFDVKGESKLQLFGEAFDLFDQAIRMEAYKSRVTLHPIFAIMRASQKVINDGTKLSDAQRAKLRDHIYSALSAHPDDPEIRGLATRLSAEVV